MLTPEKLIEKLSGLPFLPARIYLAEGRGRGRTLPTPYGLDCHIIHNCLCAGLNGAGVAPLDRSGGPASLLEEADNRSDAELQHGRRGDFSRALAERSLECLDEAAPLFQLWSGNFYHWIFECLPKTLLFEAGGFQGVYIVPAGGPFIVDSLRLLGVADERIKINSSQYFVKKAWLSEQLNFASAPRSLNLLAEMRRRLIAAAGTLPGGKYCFIRRTGFRKLMNEAELLQALAGYEFALLEPETLSLKEQISFMTNVECSLMPHGGNSTLALFQKEASVFMEFFGRKYVHKCSQTTAALLRLLYIPIPENTENLWGAYTVDMTAKSEDFTVDIRLVRTLLDNLRQGSYHLTQQQRTL